MTAGWKNKLLPACPDSVYNHMSMWCLHSKHSSVFCIKSNKQSGRAVGEAAPSTLISTFPICLQMMISASKNKRYCFMKMQEWITLEGIMWNNHMIMYIWLWTRTDFIFSFTKYKINDLVRFSLQSADKHVWIKSIFERRDYQSNSLECIY